MPEAALDRYIREVLRFSKALNLTSVHDADAFRARFVEPSLAMQPLLPETGRLLDVGSGMGIPGVPLLLAVPGLHGLLVERRQKRAEFLRHVKRVLGLDAEVYDSDVQALPDLGADIIVARAVAAPERLLRLCDRHCRTGASAVLAVPRAAQAACVSGWRFEAARHVEVGGNVMLVHKYIKGDVSRET